MIGLTMWMGTGRMPNTFFGLPPFRLCGGVQRGHVPGGAAGAGQGLCLTTVISSFYYPFILAVLQGALGEVRLTEDPLLATVLAGVMIGAGIGIVIRAGASTGGMDIPPLVLQKKLRIPVSISLYAFDCAILLLQALFSNVEQVLYGLVLVLLYTLTLNKTLMAGTGQMQLKVVSQKYEEISRAIQRARRTGAPLWLKVMGGYGRAGGLQPC